jgi:hypothetical protein
VKEVDKILNKLEHKSAQRRKRLAGKSDVPLDQIEADIQRLYEELRVARARVHNGHRDGIVKRARTERELEKLMSDD